MRSRGILVSLHGSLFSITLCCFTSHNVMFLILINHVMYTGIYNQYGRIDLADLSRNKMAIPNTVQPHGENQSTELCANSRCTARLMYNRDVYQVTWCVVLHITADHGNVICIKPTWCVSELCTLYQNNVICISVICIKAFYKSPDFNCIKTFSWGHSKKEKLFLAPGSVKYDEGVFYILLLGGKYKGKLRLFLWMIFHI